MRQQYAEALRDALVEQVEQTGRRASRTAAGPSRGGLRRIVAVNAAVAAVVVAVSVAALTHGRSSTAPATAGPSPTSSPSASTAAPTKVDSIVDAFREYARSESTGGAIAIEYVVTTAGAAKARIVDRSGRPPIAVDRDDPAVVLVAHGSFHGSDEEPFKHPRTSGSTLTRVIDVESGSVIAGGLGDQAPALTALGTPISATFTAPVQTTPTAASIAAAVAAFRESAERESTAGRITIRYVVTTVGAAETHFDGSTSRSTLTDIPDLPAIALIATGSFRWNGSLPPGATPPTGSVLTGVYDLKDHGLTARGLSDHDPGFGRLGTPTTAP